MMTPTAWAFLDVLASLVWNVYLITSLAVRVASDWKPNFDRSHLVTIRMELKPFALPAIVADYIAGMMSGEAILGLNFTLLLNALVWWLYRNLPDDDDRWKKRRKKLAESVQQVGGRLQVVPVGGRS